MANAFDQFDTTKPAAAPAAGNAFDQFDADKPVTQEEYEKKSFFEKVGGPKPGERPYEFKKKVESVDMPFPDILPGGATLASAVAREGGGLAGLAPAVAKGAVNVGRGIVEAAGQPIKWLMRGGDANIPAMQRNIETFQKAGTQPSVGQATERGVPRTMESAASKIVGGYGPMVEAATKQQAEIGKKVTSLADQLSKGASPSVAGRTIEKGLSGEGGFVDRFKAGQKQLYDKLDEFIPTTTPVNVSSTSRALASMNEDIKGAEAVSQLFKNSRIQGIESALRQDIAGTRPGVMAVPPNAPTRPGGVPSYATGRQVGIPGGAPTDQLPYEAVKKLRTLVGQELTDATLASNVPRSKWKALYAALSNDLENAAKATGNPAAVKAMDRANAFTRAGHDRIESVLDKVVSRNIPEDIFKSATSVTDMEAGATKIASVMKSLQPEERKVVQSAFLRRMGQAKPGTKTQEGDVFSSNTFFTNWERMSPQAKSVMFATKDNELRASLDAIAQTSAKIREGSKVFANPSGTAPSEALIKTGIGLVNPFTTVPTLLGMGAARITAKQMTNPKFVSWLAQASKIPESQAALRMPMLLNTLRANMADQPDDVQADTDTYIDAVTASSQAQPALQSQPQPMR